MHYARRSAPASCAEASSTLVDITALRALIELPTVVGLAGLVTPAGLLALRRMAAAASRAAAGDDAVAHIDGDDSFHLQLLALAGNDQIVEVVRALRARTRTYGLAQRATPGQLAAAAAEHFQILQARAAGDAKRTETVMTLHIAGGTASDESPHERPGSASQSATALASA